MFHSVLAIRLWSVDGIAIQITDPHVVLAIAVEVKSGCPDILVTQILTCSIAHHPKQESCADSLNS